MALFLYKAGTISLKCINKLKKCEFIIFKRHMLRVQFFYRSISTLFGLCAVAIVYNTIFQTLNQVNEDGGVSLRHTLTGHGQPVMSITWSPDDHQILTCGLEEAVRRWDVSSGACLHVYEKVGLGLISCGWFPDGKRVLTGVTDKSICIWDLDGKERECWKGQRTLKISDVAITTDGKQIISMCRETEILLLDREAKTERFLEEEQTITSFSVSRDDKFLLVNLINQEIHLWSIEGDLRRVAKYKGHKRTRFVIRSCFGGFEQAFIASGSEDSQVQNFCSYV